MPLAAIANRVRSMVDVLFMIDVGFISSSTRTSAKLRIIILQNHLNIFFDTILLNFFAKQILFT